MNTLLERVQDSNLKLQRYLTLLESSSFTTEDGNSIQILDGIATIDGKVLEPGKYKTGEDSYIEVVESGQVVSLPSSPVETIETVVETPVTEHVTEVETIEAVESPELVELKAKVLELEGLLNDKETLLNSQKVELEALVIATKKSEELIGKLTKKPVSAERISATQLSSETIEVIKTEPRKPKDFFQKQLDNLFN